MIHRILWAGCILLLVSASAVAQGPEQSKPHSAVTITSSPLQVELASSSMVNLTVTLDLGLLVCQDDFVIPVELSASTDGLPRAPSVELPATVEVTFERQVLGVGYPYNYGSSAQVSMEVGSLVVDAARNGTLVVEATFAGTLPASCHTTGTMPSATNQTTIGLVAAPAGTSGTTTFGGAAGGVDGTNPVDPASPETKDSPGIAGYLVFLSFAVVAIVLRRRNA